MTDAQSRDVIKKLDSFKSHAFMKYSKGTDEHPGNIWDLTPLQLLYAQREEIIDSWMYNETAIENLENYHPTDMA